MEIYKKAYAHLVGQVDEALTLMDTNNLLEFEHVRDILSTALSDVEMMIVDNDDPL